MNKTQRDLLASCRNLGIKPVYADVQRYATKWKKYKHMTMRDIDEVVAKLKTL